MDDAVYPAAAPDAEAEERGRRLFALPCHFTAGAVDESAIPPARLPEVAFIGRSNVGKSSLLNALAGQAALARVSRRPGRTRQINFFELGERLVLVDLPGYGYAEAAKREIARWSELTGRYFRGRASLRRVLLLLDARFGLKDTDAPLLRLLDEAAVSFQAVLTKSDLSPPGALDESLPALAAQLARHGAAHPTVHVTSARTGFGIPALRESLAALAAERPAR